MEYNQKILNAIKTEFIENNFKPITTKIGKCNICYEENILVINKCNQCSEHFCESCLTHIKSKLCPYCRGSLRN